MKLPVSEVLKLRLIRDYFVLFLRQITGKQQILEDLHLFGVILDLGPVPASEATAFFDFEH